MNRSSKILCALYAITAVLALILTWFNNILYLQDPANWSIVKLFNDLYVNYATASFVNDLFMLGVAAGIFIVVEGIRLKIRFYLLYILLSGPTAISFTFPLFLIAREMKLAEQQKEKVIPAVQ